VSNIGGAGVLAADACTDLGLTVHHPHGLTSRRLRALVPDTGAIGGPVDTTAAISAETFRQCLELLAADDEVDALIALVLPTAASGDLVAAIQHADVSIPIAAVVLGQPESVRLIPRAEGDGQIPAYGYPEAAVAAMARAARYGAWRTEPRGQIPGLPDIRTEDAKAPGEAAAGGHRRGGPGDPGRVRASAGPAAVCPVVGLRLLLHGSARRWACATRTSWPPSARWRSSRDKGDLP
jgi:acyl-CoA synthetase (NDP forming)